jgi:C1A family cysteine protease
MAKLRVTAITTAIEDNQLGWIAEENELTKLPEPEQDLRLGYNPDPASGEMPLEVREQQAKAMAALTAAVAPGAPTALDLRNYNGHNYITAVRDQSSCGSCVSFGTIATVEGTTRFVGRNDTLAIDLSEGHLFNCIARSQGRNCGIGWWVDPAMTALRDQGVVDEACSPYSPADAQCTLCTGWQGRITKIRSYQQLTAPAAMKEWIATKGPLAACFSVYSDFFAYRSGVYRRVPTALLRGGHCVCVVGYDDAQGAWICKNSWGTGWGDGGYFRIAYGECGIDASMWGVEVGSVPPNPVVGLAPLHRYWNGQSGDHFYTTNWGELGGGRYGWAYEGVQCDIAPAPRAGLVALYRYWNSRATDHFYTTNWGELGSGRYGWAYEGIQGYVSPTSQPGLLPLYRYWNGTIADHFYTTNWGELGSGRYGWRYEGIQCYVWPSSATAEGDVPETFRIEGAGGGTSVGLQTRGSGAQAWAPEGPLLSSSVPTEGSPPATFSAAEDELAAPSSFQPNTDTKEDCRCGKRDEVKVIWRRSL